MPVAYARPPEMNWILATAGVGTAPYHAAAAAHTAEAQAIEQVIMEFEPLLAASTVFWESADGLTARTAWMKKIMELTEQAAAHLDTAQRLTSLALKWEQTYPLIPILADCIRNHVTHAVLEGTNVMGVNSGAIAANEADYVQMWIRSASLLTEWAAFAEATTTFPPIPLVTQVSRSTIAATTATDIARSLAQVPGSVYRKVSEGRINAESISSMAQQEAGKARSAEQQAQREANHATQKIENQTKNSPLKDIGSQGSQMMGSLLGTFSSAASSLPSAASSAMQGLSQAAGPQALSQAAQPLQSITQMVSQVANTGQTFNHTPTGLSTSMHGPSGPVTEHLTTGGSSSGGGGRPLSSLSKMQTPYNGPSASIGSAALGSLPAEKYSTNARPMSSMGGMGAPARKTAEKTSETIKNINENSEIDMNVLESELGVALSPIKNTSIPTPQPTGIKAT